MFKFCCTIIFKKNKVEEKFEDVFEYIDTNDKTIEVEREEIKEEGSCNDKTKEDGEIHKIEKEETENNKNINHGVENLDENTKNDNTVNKGEHDIKKTKSNDVDIKNIIHGIKK
ncbi:hypothetical protein MKS88_004740 [Plasmodium brasilianum]|uniref:Uncharacterized protein n=1 Tax=Plasmodium brasilianum TaxID=5824 RepID=A0ACB9Y3P0_PLABR|nr:hypothetical protein MKS88_004740 [Plasmodium brasilianum]